MYPLKMTKDGPLQGHAVANDEAEHEALSAQGYEPKLQKLEADPHEEDGQGHTVESVRAMLDAQGKSYDRRWGLARLMTLL